METQFSNMQAAYEAETSKVAELRNLVAKAERDAKEARSAETGLRARLDQMSVVHDSEAPTKNEAMRQMQSKLQSLQEKHDNLLTASTESQAKTANVQTLLNLKNQQLAKLGDDYGQAVNAN